MKMGLPGHESIDVLPSKKAGYEYPGIDESKLLKTDEERGMRASIVNINPNFLECLNGDENQKNIKSCIEFIKGDLSDRPVTNNPIYRHIKYKQLISAYSELLKSCDAYFSHWHFPGAKKTKIKQIKQIAENEATLLMNSESYIVNSPVEDGTTWKKVLTPEFYQTEGKNYRKLAIDNPYDANVAQNLNGTFGSIFNIFPHASPNQKGILLNTISCRTDKRLATIRPQKKQLDYATKNLYLSASRHDSDSRELALVNAEIAELENLKHILPMFNDVKITSDITHAQDINFVTNFIKEFGVLTPVVYPTDNNGILSERKQTLLENGKEQFLVALTIARYPESENDANKLNIALSFAEYYYKDDIKPLKDTPFDRDEYSRLVSSVGFFSDSTKCVGTFNLLEAEFNDFLQEQINESSSRGYIERKYQTFIDALNNAKSTTPSCEEQCDNLIFKAQFFKDNLPSEGLVSLAARSSSSLSNSNSSSAVSSASSSSTNSPELSSASSGSDTESSSSSSSSPITLTPKSVHPKIPFAPLPPAVSPRSSSLPPNESPPSSSRQRASSNPPPITIGSLSTGGLSRIVYCLVSASPTPEDKHEVIRGILAASPTPEDKKGVATTLGELAKTDTTVTSAFAEVIADPKDSLSTETLAERKKVVPKGASEFQSEREDVASAFVSELTNKTNNISVFNKTISEVNERLSSSAGILAFTDLGSSDLTSFFDAYKKLCLSGDDNEQLRQEGLNTIVGIINSLGMPYLNLVKYCLENNLNLNGFFLPAEKTKIAKLSPFFFQFQNLVSLLKKKGGFTPDLTQALNTCDIITAIIIPTLKTILCVPIPDETNYTHDNFKAARHQYASNIANMHYLLFCEKANINKLGSTSNISLKGRTCAFYDWKVKPQLLPLDSLSDN